jgi:hypothetical protein
MSLAQDLGGSQTMSTPTEGSGILHFIGEHWLALLAFIGTLVGAFYFVYHTLKKTIPELVERIKNVEEVVGRLDGRATELGFAKKKDIFDVNGKPRFQPHEMCAEIREDCDRERQIVKREIFAKLDEVTTQMNTNIHTMNRVLAKVDTLMEKDERQERMEEMQELAATLAEKMAESIASKMTNK